MELALNQKSFFFMEEDEYVRRVDEDDRKTNKVKKNAKERDYKWASPFLDEETGKVWIHIGYGKWELCATDDSRAKYAQREYSRSEQKLRVDSERIKHYREILCRIEGALPVIEQRRIPLTSKNQNSESVRTHGSSSMTQTAAKKSSSFTATSMVCGVLNRRKPYTNTLIPM
ncbi:hypothetical protein KC573_00280 [candidate division WWE3 bacterium]|uniref:Uncharacterized protein n=1 Tax=candidate division WWE3 bacterium TaxID=2053526 RepID=A0A955RWP0_UNCKA|nr:hypothetical protein [candidate division WWE3 bacterium]